MTVLWSPESVHDLLCVVIGRAVSLGAANDPDIGSGRADTRKSLWNRSAPAGWRYKEIDRLGAGRPPARRREHIRPHVEHRQEVIPPARVRHGDDLRFFGEIEPRNGIERIEVDPHDHLQIGRRKRRDIHERIHRPFAKFFPRLDVRGLLSRNVYRDERIEVEVGIDRDGARSLLGDRRRSTLCHRRRRKCWADKESQS
jgi:hypothetical protein